MWVCGCVFGVCVGYSVGVGGGCIVKISGVVRVCRVLFVCVVVRLCSRLWVGSWVLVL